MEPLISTSLERMSLPVCSAIYFWCSVVDCLGCSLIAGRLVSSDAEVNDPSPIEDIGFCGMNFFNTSLLLWPSNALSTDSHVRRASFSPFIVNYENFCSSILQNEGEKPWSVSRALI